MRIPQLLILLLSYQIPFIASAHLVERQPEGASGEWDPGQLIWNGLGTTFTLLGGAGTAIGNMFLNPQNSDSSTTMPTPDTDTESNQQTRPDSPEAVPASPPSSASLSPAEPVYNLNINKNDPSSLPGTGPDIPGSLPSVSEKCDVSLDSCFLPATFSMHDPCLYSD